MKNNRTIGIIGGMGPQASAKFLEVFIGVCSKDFGTKSDSDFPEIILNSIAVPDFISDGKNLKVVLNILNKRVKLLKKFNPSFFAITCNTAHLMLGDLQKTTSVPFVSIIDEVTKKVVESKIKSVGVLGTPVTINSGLYSNALRKENINTISPSKKDRKIVEKVILNILAGKANKKDVQALIDVANNLKNKGAQGIILGCTELPLIFPKEFPIPIFDSIEILARSLAQKALERNINYD